MIIPEAPVVGELSEGMAPVPEATYNFRIHKAEYVAVPKRAESKPYIRCQFVVTGPGETPFLGRYVFGNYTLAGDGSFRLRELLEATNHPADFRLTDSDQLVGLEFAGATIVKKGTEGRSDQNEIRKHLPVL